MNTKEALQLIAKDRTIIISLVVIALLTVCLLVVTALGLRPSDVQVPIRYSIFGNVTIYRDKWFYLLAFPLFALLVAMLHGGIAARLVVKRRNLALGFLIATCFILLLATGVMVAVLNLVNASI